MEISYRILYIGRPYYTHDPFEDQRHTHLPVVLEDTDRNKYLVILHGEDAEMPWHVGDEVWCTLAFSVKEQYGRMYQEITAQGLASAGSFSGEVMTKKGELKWIKI